MTQHAFRREYDKRFPPGTQSLPPQEMKVLRGIRGLANLDVIARGKLKEAFDARAGVLRPLALITMGEKQHDARQQIPFVLARDDELINYDLRAIREIAELRFPKYERFGEVAAEAIFEAQHG